MYETALKIVNVVEDIHRKKYLLPAIQREFVWESYKIERLFDSLMRDYPISSFLFWSVEKENVKKYQFYEFLREFHARDNKHNPKADVNGEEDILAVLDGQQRLTSIYIALKGSLAEKLPRKRWYNDEAYPQKRLYVNLVKKSKSSDLEYNFKFLSDNEADTNDENNYWFRVGEILNLKEPGDVSNYLTEFVFDEYDKEKRKFANKVLFKLHSIIFLTPSISYYKESSQSLDKVLNIFIRINSGGTILTYSDLLLSIATAQWKHKDAREEINNFVDRINKIGNGFNFNKDFVLKSCLVLNDFSDIAFKVDNFNKSNMLKIEENWENVSDAVKLAVKLIATFGYNRDNLTSNNSIIPIAYYLYKINATNSFVDSSHNIIQKNNIRRWLLLSLVKRVFGGQPDSVLIPIRRLINDNLEDFPVTQIIKQFEGTNKSLLFSDEDIEKLSGYKYGKNFTFSVLSLLYPNLDYRNLFHIDHIYPKSLMSKRSLRQRGYSEEKIEKYINYVNFLGNLQLLEANYNTEKSNTEFEIWLNEIFIDEQNLKDFKIKNFIPNVNLDFDNFIEFFEEREKLIMKEFKRILQLKKKLISDSPDNKILLNSKLVNMNKSLKAPFRFEHNGVIDDFKELINQLKEFNNNYKFGSSGDGEITIQGQNGSVYVRKYRRNLKWRLIYRINSKVYDPIYKFDMKSVIKEITTSDI